MLSIKPNAGVSIKKLSPQILLGAIIIRDVYLAHGHDCVITVGCNGKHMVGSKHGGGDALDFRTHNITVPGELEIVYKHIEIALGGDDSEFDVVLEAQGTDNEHLHLEYDPD